MDRSRYLELLESDSLLLSDGARGADPAAPVPSCPGWTVRDVVEHTAEVYEHKVACIALAGPAPDPWPPEPVPGRDPLARYDDARVRLLDTLRGTDPGAPSWTWWPDDQTAGFWVRRMAQETAVHRVDVQSVAGAEVPVDAELAVDGVDEVLTMMLAGDWSDEPQEGSTARLSVGSRDLRWQVELTPERVVVEAGGRPATVHVTGEPSELLLWMWGRRPDGAVTVQGDREAARRLRARLALATQ